jgi:hypothetical protein
MMGFDLCGTAMNGEETYFRNNVWWWRPLWNYVCEVCDIDKETAERGCYNDGHLIDGNQARIMAEKLRREIAIGNTAKYAEEYRKEQKEMPDETCDICGGKGVRNDKIVQGKCNGCDGKGKRRPWATHYPFSVENVKEFCDFLEISERGFNIW